MHKIIAANVTILPHQNWNRSSSIASTSVHVYINLLVKGKGQGLALTFGTFVYFKRNKMLPGIDV